MNRKSVNQRRAWTAALFLFGSLQLFPCTSILVTRGAAADGSCIITYSCDGEFHPRLNIIPAADHEPGSMLDVRGFRGVIGKIPQVAHTWKVVGLMNEHQLAIGETTFDGRLELVNREAMMHYYPLMLLALQRARTAREAITVMTDLVEKHGYSSSGESFSIADKNEAWIMEMVGTGPGGRGAVWVALRLPDGMVSAHANMARIGTFPLNDPENCRYSKNVTEFAIEKGYYDPDSGKPFHFADAYCPPTEEQVRYSARRVWSIFRRVAPSMNLSAAYSDGRGKGKPYPLWIRPDRKLNLRDVMNLHRDHYEGTPFDMTRDLSAGPFGAPDRWRPMTWKVDGKTYGWERPIATQQAGFVFASQSRRDVPDEVGGVFWYAMDNPHTCVFVPLYTTITELPPSYTRGSLQQFSRDSAWWAFNFVANYANLRYSHMIKEIQAVQERIEDLQFALQPAIEQTALNLLRTDPSRIAPFLTRWCVSNAETAVQDWWKLADHLITKYNDGYIKDENGRPREVGYPEEWLREELRRNPDRFRIRQARKGEGEL